MEDPRSLFFLHHGESPGAILVPQPLIEDNYPTWARATKMALDAKSKLGFVDGSMTASMAVTPLEKKAWSKCNSMISSWILNCVSPHITASVIYRDTALEFLNGLNDAYSQVRTQILMMEPTPSIDKAFSLVIQEERQRSLGFSLGSSVESTALAVRNLGFGNASKKFKGNTRKSRPMCSYCGKLGYIHEKCYKLVGFPPGYKHIGKTPMAN
ncbi:hypothetical protein ACB092_08G134700 [Castanea dentata]